MSGGARILIGLIVAATIGIAVYVVRTAEPPKKIAATQPATAPTTKPASRPAEPPPVASYVDLIRAHQPSFPATQPLVVPVSLDDAAHVVLTDPVYVCSRGDLWLTHSRAATFAGKLVGATKQQIHLGREKVVFVHWMLEFGQWQPTVFCEDASRPGTFFTYWGSDEGKLVFQGPIDFSQALSLDEFLVSVGGNDAVYAHARGKAQVQRIEIGPKPRLMYTRRGVIAWSETGKAMELLDGKWKQIGENLLQPLPMLDGSMLKIVRTGDETVELQMESLVAPKVDEKAIVDLIGQLSDSSAQVRQKAFNELQRHGPGAWPVLEKNMEGQPPDALNSLRQLLKNRQSPTIAGLTLNEKKLKPIARLRDGGTVVLAEAGVYVSVPHQNESKLVAPAWICMRPGTYVDLLTDALVKDFSEGKTQLIAIGDEWIVTDDILGPRRFVGNASIPLVKDHERNFFEPVAIDRRGRWVFRDPETKHTLIIDPTLPDPTPKFPVWLFSVRNGSTGWDKDNWPCMKSGGTWSLRETAWEPLAKDQEMQTEFTGPTSSNAALLTDPDGNEYFGGETFLRVKRKDGTEFTWQLPPTAIGAGVPHLFRTADGTLFLINQSSRVLRIAPTPKGLEPFEVQATFTRKIPDMSTSRRIWMDPAGRILIAYEENRLAICFPTGIVPQQIANMMPPEEE